MASSPFVVFLQVCRARKGQEKLLALIKENPYISISSKAKECGMSVKTIRNMIDELRNSHLVNTSGVRSEILWHPQNPLASSEILKSSNPQIVNFQDRSAIISSPPSSSERSGEGEGGDEMR